MAIKETVYLAHNNSIYIKLKVDGEAVDLSPVTKIILSDSGCAWAVDSSSSPGVFDWSDGLGVLKIKLGDEPIPSGTYSCYLFIFDPTNPDGIVWGDKISIKVVSICTAPAT